MSYVMQFETQKKSLQAHKQANENVPLNVIFLKPLKVITLFKRKHGKTKIKPGNVPAQRKDPTDPRVTTWKIILDYISK